MLRPAGFAAHRSPQRGPGAGRQKRLQLQFPGGDDPEAAADSVHGCGGPPGLQGIGYRLHPGKRRQGAGRAHPGGLRAGAQEEKIKDVSPWN